MSVETAITPQSSDKRGAVSSLSVVARIGACGRSADRRRAVPPPRVTATIACAPASLGERDRRLAERVRVVAVARRARHLESREPAAAGADAFLGIADDRVERLHGARRKGADSRLARQHDRVDAVGDRVGGVAHFGAGRPGLHGHRFEHLRGQNHRHPALPRARA